jgi:hypothetical protein
LSFAHDWTLGDCIYFIQESTRAIASSLDATNRPLFEDQLAVCVRNFRREFIDGTAMINFTERDWEQNIPCTGIRKAMQSRLRTLIPEHQASSSVHLTSSGSKRPYGETIQSRKFVRIDFNVATSELFTIPAEYLENSGLGGHGDSLVLYCRKEFRTQFEFLSDAVIRRSELGFIYGPPGTGKSATAFAFATTLDSATLMTTWVHLDPFGPMSCVRFDGDKMTHCDFLKSNITELLEFLRNNPVGKPHLVMVDGFVSDAEQRCVVEACVLWRKERSTDHRLVLIASMSASALQKSHKRKIHGSQDFFVGSWHRSEYLSAVENPTFFNHVKRNLDSNIALDGSSLSTGVPTLEELVISKHHFAGASSRFMFGFTTTTVILTILSAISRTPDPCQYINGTLGDCVDQVVNQLYSCFQITNMRKKTSLISSFAASEMAIKVGPGVIKSLSDAIKGDSNPAMQGWLFQMWFFAKIRKGGITISAGDTRLTWLESQVLDFDPADKNKLPISTWLKPSKWNQGGYDAVYVKDESAIRFVQVTRGDQHSLKLQYFFQLLQTVSDFHTFSKVEIFFLVSKEKIDSFHVSDVEGAGLLSQFSSDGTQPWVQGQEAKQVRIFQIDDEV